VIEYAPTEIKRAVVGFGRAEKHQVGAMVKLLLALDAVPSPHDAADALAVAICHVNNSHGAIARAASMVPAPSTARRAAAGRRGGIGADAPARAGGRPLTSWRDYRP
jgi:crossover junction endodeoxyribonuclease RuvC